MSRHATDQTYDRTTMVRLLGASLLAIRLVLGWIYWGGGSRRFIYAPQKLNPHAHSWMANKFQAAMPGAVLGLGHIISAILLRPELLYALLIGISVIEVLCGIGLLVGLLTRACAIAGVALSVALILIFGWQGATCIDEWTMAVSTFAMGASIFVGGGGLWSVDAWIMRRHPRMTDSAWFRWFGSAPLGTRELEMLGKSIGVVTLIFTLVFYNFYRGSIFTPFHSGPVSPAKHHIALTQATLSSGGDLKVLAYLNGGTPAVPAHIISVGVIGPKGVIEQWQGRALEKIITGHIHNIYPYNQFKPGLYGIKARVGAKAWIALPGRKGTTLKPGPYTIIFRNINGMSFKAPTTVGP